MSEESKSNAPTAPTPLGEIEHGPSQFEQFLEKNLKKLILAAVLVVIAIAAFVVMSQLAEAGKREAGNALLAAESPEDYRKVIAEHGDSKAASSARLLLAGQLWDEGKTSEATETLQRLADQEDGPASSQAQFALASLLFREEKNAEAKKLYEAILANPDAKYLHPLSLVALGDIAQADGDQVAAKKYYQRKLDEFPGYADQNIASTRLNLVGVDEPQKVPPPPAPEPPTNAENGVSPAFTNPLPKRKITLPTPPTPETVEEITPESEEVEDETTTESIEEAAPTEEEKETGTEAAESPEEN